ncbi:MAG: DUF1990 domain-containing protein [Ilumatobacteraceae bacterium]
MSIRLMRPSPDELRSLIADAESASLTYAPVGISAWEVAPAGYRFDRFACTLGRGDAVFGRASDALRNWRVHKGAGLIVLAEGPPVCGAVVAMSAPLPIGYIDAVCRIVAVVEEHDRFGFVYGSLPVHPVQGEESFIAVRSAEGNVTFEITAVSQPRLLLARACPPIARKLQRSAMNRYLQAMRSAATG